jgi:hypothetical protein
LALSRSGRHVAGISAVASPVQIPHDQVGGGAQFLIEADLALQPLQGIDLLEHQREGRRPQTDRQGAGEQQLDQTKSVLPECVGR